MQPCNRFGIFCKRYFTGISRQFHFSNNLVFFFFLEICQKITKLYCCKVVQQVCLLPLLWIWLDAPALQITLSQVSVNCWQATNHNAERNGQSKILKINPFIGGWSSKAAKEAAKYGKVNLVLPKVSKHTGVPDQSTWNLDKNASYVHYCDNETADGVEFPFIPETNGVPIVADMSSNIFSRPFDVTKVRSGFMWHLRLLKLYEKYLFQFGLIYAGAQKNFGPSGITLVIVREDLLNHALPITPAILNLKENYAANSEYNTPPTFMYVIEEFRTFSK